MNGFFLRRPSEGLSPGRVAWNKFRLNPTGMAALVFICFVSLMALVGYLITPDPTPFANRQILEIGTMPPGFSVKLLKIPLGGERPKQSVWNKMLYGQKDNFSFLPVRAFEVRNDSLVAQLFSAGVEEPVEIKS